MRFVSRASRNAEAPDHGVLRGYRTYRWKQSMFGMNQKTAPSLALGLTLVIGGCATPPSDPAARVEFEATNDPLEPLNRRIFDSISSSIAS